MRRAQPGSAAMPSSVRCSARGFELYESSTSVMPPRRRHTSPRRVAGENAATRRRHHVQRHAEVRGHRHRRQRVGQVPAADERHARSPPARPACRDRRARAGQAVVAHVGGAHVGGRRRCRTSSRAPASSPRAPSPAGRRRWRRPASTRWRPRGSRPSRRRWPRSTGRTPSALPPPASTRARRARRGRPASGSRRRGSCRARPPRSRGGGAVRSSDSGSPMWLLKLPWLRNTRNRVAEQVRGHLLGRRLAGAAGDGHDLSRPTRGGCTSPRAAARASCRPRR